MAVADRGPRGTGPKAVLKVFGIIAVMGLLVNVVIAALKHLAKLPVPSFLTVIVGWLILFALVGVVVSGIVVLVQIASRPTPPPSTQQVHMQDRPPGRYPDPNDPKLQRYFDGRNWTSGTAPRE